MSYRYLLDTDTLSDLVKNPQGRVTERIRTAGADTVCTSIVVASELRFGALKRDSARLTAQLDAILAALPVLALEAPVDHCYAELRLQLERGGKPIDPNDMLIAAHGLALEAIVVTGNSAEFLRVPGLRVENWLRPE